jgi:succinylarginine dihydrolase
MTTAVEANFDGLVGPTHNYAGLSFGNVASFKNAQRASNPREAALQGLRKMKAMADLGLAQGVLPPHERPHIPTLRKLGFTGRDADILAKAQSEAPHLLASVASASAMWTANAATVSPSADTADAKVHFTPANLCSHLHRSIEPATTARVLKAIFSERKYFAHHHWLPATPGFGDEGAANHTRLCSDYGQPGLELFVFGAGDPGRGETGPKKYPARQTRQACGAIVRLHKLEPAQTLLAQQNPDVIDAGVFHNDVIAVGNRELLLYHERAFHDASAIRTYVCTHFSGERRPAFVEVRTNEVSVADAVSSYLFNSQIVCPPAGGMLLIVARECEENPRVWAKVQEIVAAKDNPITDVRVFDLRQSMDNGGGPACLRLRVALKSEERLAVNSRCWITPKRYEELVAWVGKHYRDKLTTQDLADPALLDESRTALDRLTQILGIGPVYDFQR